MKHFIFLLLTLFISFQSVAGLENPIPVRLTLASKNSSKDAILLKADAKVKINAVATEVTLTHHFKNMTDS